MRMKLRTAVSFGLALGLCLAVGPQPVQGATRNEPILLRDAGASPTGLRLLTPAMMVPVSPVPDKAGFVVIACPNGHQPVLGEALDLGVSGSAARAQPPSDGEQLAALLGCRGAPGPTQ